MDDLLTAREVQELLKIDRTTVYRMLKDGRLTGVKVGQQWRFPRREIDALLGGSQAAPRTEPPAFPAPDGPPPEAPGRQQGAGVPGRISGAEVLPLHCIQAIQDVFAELADVAALTTSPQGDALTTVSNGCRYCALVQSTPAGRAACRAEWAALAACSQTTPHVATCHAGLSYLYGRIDVAGRPAATLVAGQFRRADRAADPGAVAARYGLDRGLLADALAEVPLHDAASAARIGSGVRRVAQTFAAIAQERAAMIGRLRHIAALSTLDDGPAAAAID